MTDPSYEPHFSAEHLARKIYWLNKRIESLPKGLIVKHRGLQYVRIVPSNMEKRLDSEEGRLLADAVTKRKRLQAELDSLNASMKSLYPKVILEDPPPINRALPVPQVMTLEYYNNPPEIENPYPKESSYLFEDLNLRSRFEVLAAEAFRDLGIPFKNEIPVITTNGVYFLDMVTPVPERGRCVGFEFCGKADDFKYMNSLNTKVMSYLSVGLIPNHDVIFVFGGKTWLPSMREIKNAIIFGIENC